MPLATRPRPTQALASPLLTTRLTSTCEQVSIGSGGVKNLQDRSLHFIT
jgi:hypothetical protein